MPSALQPSALSHGYCRHSIRGGDAEVPTMHWLDDGAVATATTADISGPTQPPLWASASGEASYAVSGSGSGLASVLIAQNGSEAPDPELNRSD